MFPFLAGFGSEPKSKAQETLIELKTEIDDIKNDIKKLKEAIGLYPQKIGTSMVYLVRSEYVDIDAYKPTSRIIEQLSEKIDLMSEALNLKYVENQKVNINKHFEKIKLTKKTKHEN